MNIEGRICRLRALEPRDLDAMYEWENDTEAWRASGTAAPFSRHVLSRLIDEQRFDIYATRQLRLVIEPAEPVAPIGPDCADGRGAAIGAVDLFEFDPQNLRAGVGIIVASPCRRRGFAADALAAAERYARETLHLHQLWCSVAADNAASLRLFEKAGYLHCGRRRDWLLAADGQRIDEILFQKILGK